MLELKLVGECPSMNKTVSGKLIILSNLEEATTYITTMKINSSKILVTHQIDWTWTRVLKHFVGCITNHGTRVSRAAEVLAIMMLPGALGTKNATTILQPEVFAQIICKGNQAQVYIHT
ncbi:MAG: PEP-utilizing enzyme [Candidatus Hodarchaeota archaeon]